MLCPAYAFFFLKTLIYVIIDNINKVKMGLNIFRNAILHQVNPSTITLNLKDNWVALLQII